MDHARFDPRGPQVSSNDRAEHGTPAGYRRLHPDGVRCAACKRAWNTYRAEQRAKARARGTRSAPRSPAMCGTRSGYNRHVKDVATRRAAGDTDAKVTCQPCLDAYNAQQSEQHTRREYGRALIAQQASAATDADTERLLQLT